MRSQPVEALEIVEVDLREACAFYDSWRAEGGAYFRQQFRETAQWIEWNPELFPRKHRHFRRAIIRNTSFGVFFVIRPGVTTLVAVFDLRQKPKHIRRALSGRA